VSQGQTQDPGRKSNLGHPAKKKSEGLDSRSKNEGLTWRFTLS
jgi:hypothetical protein